MTDYIWYLKRLFREIQTQVVSTLWMPGQPRPFLLRVPVADPGVSTNMRSYIGFA